MNSNKANNLWQRLKNRLDKAIAIVYGIIKSISEYLLVSSFTIAVSVWYVYAQGAGIPTTLDFFFTPTEINVLIGISIVLALITLHRKRDVWLVLLSSWIGIYGFHVLYATMLGDIDSTGYLASLYLLWNVLAWLLVGAGKYEYENIRALALKVTARNDMLTERLEAFEKKAAVDGSDHD